MLAEQSRAAWEQAGGGAFDEAARRRLLAAVAERRRQFDTHSWFRKVRKAYRWLLGRIGVRVELPH